jgi:hypothetical protein
MSEKRIEPGAGTGLGPSDRLESGRPRAPALRRWPAWPVLALAAAALLALAALGYFREQIGAKLVPDSATNLQIERAQAALVRGELSRADGDGAREQFQAVLARDPDHPAARAGLAQVRDAAVLQARAALQAGNLQAAQARIDLARSMAAPATELDALQRGLQEQQSQGAGVADLLERARAAQAQGRLEQLPDGALALYAQVLSRQPDSALALQGRREILSGLLQRAEAALAEDDLATAQALVARVVQSDPSHLDLPPLQARLGEAQARRQQQREAELERAERELAQGRLEAAVDVYRDLLAEEPGLAPAVQGLEAAAEQAARRGIRAAADFDFPAADAWLVRAEQWDPDSAAIGPARARLVQAQAVRGALPVTGADPVRLQSLLVRADAALRLGALLEPPGESAWDLLRQAEALAPGSPEVAQRQQEYDRRARACFEDDLAAGRLSAAQGCLDAMAARGVVAGDLAPERRRLADRWLAYADERLGANELALARRAFGFAQALYPAHPGLAALSERLARAGG